MARKNLLSDSDYTSGRDNRFKNAVHIGRVSEVVCDETQANVRVIMPDKLDHEGTPLVTKPVPVLQRSSAAKRSFAMPRVGDNVVLTKLANGTSNYLVMGSFYTTSDPPPVTDPKLDYTEWEGGHSETRDANEDADVFLTQDFKGGWAATIKKDVNFKTTDGAKFNVEADGDMLMKSATGNIDIKSPSGTVNIEQQNIHLKGTVTIDGNIVHTGDMSTTGRHVDGLGPHAGGLREGELLARLEALEARVLALEGGPHGS
jgi:phage baseplate assembly protein gpV